MARTCTLRFHPAKNKEAVEMLFGGGMPMAFALSRGMARVIGVDLVRAATEGRISRGELEKLVDTCATCPKCAHCGQFLAVTVKAAETPDYCLIKAPLENLRTR